MGGKANFAVDRMAGDQYREMFPASSTSPARAGFLVRSVTYLAGEAGIRQFLDIGTGLPTFDNTHEFAQRVAPESPVVYVENDGFGAGARPRPRQHRPRLSTNWPPDQSAALRTAVAFTELAPAV